MNADAWQLEKHRAHLQIGSLKAEVDLLRPGQGLAAPRWGAEPAWPAGTGLLGVEIPSHAVANKDSLLEAYVRGPDLVTAYRPSASWPVRVDVLWRVEVVGPSASSRPTIDAVVSVRTELLESRPELAVTSVVPGAEVWRLADADSARFERLDVPAEGSLVADRETGPGVLLFRLPGSETSYVELVYPPDFQRDELGVDRHVPGAVRVRHRLFPLPLEKGVILRARLRGAFLPRHDDFQHAAAEFLAFRAEEPLLGT